MKTKILRKIQRVELVRYFDESPDTSHLGEYSNEAGPLAIDRQERGDMGRHEYRYFNPAMSGEETGNPESPEQDYQRMESLQRGDWCYYGIRAEARIVIGDVCQNVTSGGLWGIESDSGEEYFAEVAGEELHSLQSQLEAMGFSRKAIATACREAKEQVESKRVEFIDK